MSSKKQPANFVDLRKGRPKRAQLIQDVFHPELKRRWNLSLAWLQKLNRLQQVMLLVVALALTSLGVEALTPTKDPVPTSIKQQVNFVIIYPGNYSVDNNSWRYSSNQQTLTFSAKKNNLSVVFTEQKTPLEFQNDAAAYNRFIGSLRPSANFKSPLGTVSLAEFVTAGDFQPQGHSGILNAKGTLVIAHPNRELNDNEWRIIFDSLKSSN